MNQTTDSGRQNGQHGQARVGIDGGSQIQGEDKKTKAFLTQPRTDSKLSAKLEATGDVPRVACSEQKIASEDLFSQKAKGKKTLQIRRHSHRSLPRDEERTHSRGEEQTCPGTDEVEARLKELDELYPIPEGWPCLHDKIFKRRALFIRKPMCPAVAKALEHLRQLQDRIELWSREVELEILSRQSSTIAGSVVGSARASSVGETSPSRLTAESGRKQLRFVSDSALSPTLDNFANGQSSILHSPHTSTPTTQTAVSTRTEELSIQGMGAIMPKADTATAEIDQEIPHLRAEEVIDEVLVLLGRLETDYRDTQSLYEKECKRSQWLQSKIDRLAAKRMYELPRAVQREHEACATDIAEMKWHCSYRSRQKNRVQSQVQAAEMMNARLLEDITFVQKHCPLVEEKLELERDAMKRIDEAQAQTTDMLNKTYEKLKRTEDKSAEAHGKADMERAHIKRELEAVRDALKEINSELDEAKALHLSYSHQCSDLRQKLREAAEEKIVLLSKCENAKAAEKIQSKRVKAIQEKIIEAEFEHRKAADHNFQLTSQIERTKNEQMKEVADLESESKEKLADLRDRQQGCRKMSMEIEDSQQKLKNFAKQKVFNEKNMERIKREMSKVDSQLSVVEEEYDKIKVINMAVRSKLIGEEDKAKLTEENLQGTYESLRKQVKEETHARTVLQARISSDTTDLAKQQVEAKKKKAKVSKKAAELKEVVTNTLASVEVLRAKHTQGRERSEELKKSITELQVHREQTGKSLKSEVKDLEPECEELKKEILNASKRLDYMAYRTDLLNKKLNDIAKSRGFMDKVIATTQEAITELEKDLEEITIQLTTGQKQHEDLKSSLTEVTKRMEDGETYHLEYVKERREVMEKLQIDLKEKLKENKELAHQFRLVQQEHLKLKEEFLEGLEGRINLEASLKDHKQLSGLQLRLHHALVRYYYIRGLFNKNELHRFEEMSAENGRRIQSLQGEMDKAIQTITSFLTDQLDGTAARVVHAAANAALMKDDGQSVGVTPDPVGVATSLVGVAT